MPPAPALAWVPMGKKDRTTPRMAYASLRDMPGTRVMFWVVDDCPYCGERHLHIAGHLRMADPGESLGEYPAPCDPSRMYEVALTPRPKRKQGKQARRKARRDGKDEVLDDDKW